MSDNTPTRIHQIIKNLEGVLKTSRNEDQRRRVFQDIQKWKKELDRVETEFVDDDDNEETYSGGYNNDANENSYDSGGNLETYEFLKHIPIKQLNESTSNREINEIYTFIKHIEDEYIAVLSEYHLKTDYSHAMTRDSFYTMIHDCFVAFRNYADVASKTDNESLPSDFRNRMKMNLQAEYRNIVTKIGAFLRKLYTFVDELVIDYKNHGHLLTNAGSKLKFDHPGSLGEKPILDGCTVIEGLQDFHHFLIELLDYLNLPEIKKNNEKL